MVTTSCSVSPSRYRIMLEEMNPAPPVTRIRLRSTVPLPQLPVDVVDRSAFDIALDALQVLAQHGHQEALQTEHEQHERSREVAMADPEAEAPETGHRGSQDTQNRQRSTHPLHHLRPESGEHGQPEADQAGDAVAAGVGAGLVLELHLDDLCA